MARRKPKPKPKPVMPVHYIFVAGDASESRRSQ